MKILSGHPPGNPDAIPAPSGRQRILCEDDSTCVSRFLHE